ncbi:MAG TPA: XylR family transcriptional regulator [Planctomycetaceae bacterium]|nr:XylR family transcriptional regulator [Planctomycetaceae bacterium]
MHLKQPKVALLIETARSYGRGLLRGIAKYSRLHGPWQFHLTPGDFEQMVPKMRDWGGTGIIARVLNEKMAEAIMQTGVPAVFLDFPPLMMKKSNGNRRRYIEMSSDSEGAARMAAFHLRDKQLVHFAFAGYPSQIWSEKREKAFVQAVREAGHSVHVYKPPLRSGRLTSWEKEEPALAAWLSSLPTPLGLMACNDQRGREVLDVCEAVGIRVPEKIAVVGVDNDDILCDLSSPPLSSIALNTEKGGYVAAGVLHDMMRGRRIAVENILVEPLAVVERRSTNIVAVNDDDIAATLRFIHLQPPGCISIDAVVREVAISRRALEIKFRKVLGKSILDEIRRVRIEHSKRLLRETTLAIPRIAMDVGFRTPSYFTQVFKTETGMTPAKYRSTIHEGEM